MVWFSMEKNVAKPEVFLEVSIAERVGLESSKYEKEKAKPKK